MPRIDHTYYLAHFTKPSEKNPKPGIKSESALSNLISILRDKTIKKSAIPWTGVPAVCFTECPWNSLLKHAEAYSPYGIGFNKPYVYMKGGNPVFYANPDIFTSQENGARESFPS